MANVFAGRPAMSPTARRLLRAPVVRGLLARVIGLGCGGCASETRANDGACRRGSNGARTRGEKRKVERQR